MALNRIMVVDDFRDWRREVCSILEQHQELSVVGEASDGAEAVKKAAELKPDVIVLDIGLPKLNGIEAAARIAKLFPESRVLFLSQDNDVGTVQVAFETEGVGVCSQAERRRRTVECCCRPSSRSQVCQ